MSIAPSIDTQQLDWAMSRMQLMYAKPEHPYYILAPDYRETSSGVATLHYLCHLLNLMGREAYICGAKVVNPDLKTPLLTPEDANRHTTAGRMPIAVYPEVVVGDPLKCPVVARFLLNFEGFLNSKGMQEGAEDLLFYSGKLIAAKKGDPDGDLLNLPIIDVSLFRPAEATTPKQGAYLYQNRFPLEQVDYSQLPEGIRLLSVANPLSLAELAKLLKVAEVLYTYEWSMTCVMALLCGCPVIFIPGHGIDQNFLDRSLIGGCGFAMLDEPDAVAKARAGCEGALQRFVAVTLPFWQQLDVFIEKTQAAARKKAEISARGMSTWLEGRTPDTHQLSLIRERLAANHAPVFGVIVLDDGSSGERLLHLLKSLGPDHCLYRNLQVVVVGAESGAQLPGVRVQYLPCGAKQQVDMLNQVLRDMDADWFVIVEADVEFTPAGLLMAALDLINVPEGCLAVFADEAMRMADGSVGISLRPDLNLDLLISFPASISRHWLLRRDAFIALGGFDSGCAGAFELEYQLRLIEQQGLGCVGHVSELLLVCDALSLSDCPEESAVIERHIKARGYTQAKVLSHLPGQYRVDYGHFKQPGVSILIVLDGQLEQFQRCIDSLLENTDYPSYEVLLLDPDNQDEQVLQWLTSVEQVGSEQLRVLRFAGGQPLAILRNEAARRARGEFLFWLDAAAGIVSRGWLQQLLNHAQRPEVGAVGAKLLSADGRIHHAGLVLGLGGVVGRAFEGFGHQDAGYLQRLKVDQDYSALSSECLMVRRELFLQAGGYDEDPLFAPWVDVDLCLKLHQAGYLNVWTPHVQILMGAQQVKQASFEQQDAMYARWLRLLARDPAYSPNMSLQHKGGFKLADNAMVWRPLRSWRPLSSVLAHQADLNACGQYRVVEPFSAMKEAGLIEGALSSSLLQLSELERFQPDTIVLQREICEQRLGAMRRMHTFSRAFKVFELSDYLPDLPLDSALRQQMPVDILGNLQRSLGYVDRLVVPTSALAEVLCGLHHDIRIVESRLSNARWLGLQGLRRVGNKPRVGWAGGVDQVGELEVIAGVIKALAGEVEWVFLGSCPRSLRPYVHEFHVDVPHERYPTALASLNLDLALAPVEQSLFNECKSNLRLLEYGACGFPVIASDVRCYQGFSDLPVTLVSNQFQAWVDAIRMHLSDLDSASRLGDELRVAVHRGWMLDDALPQWCKAWLPG